MKVDDIYQHYKGTKVRVLTTALHSETQEELVIYVHLDDGAIWARPKNMFFETIEHQGKTQPRFAKIDQNLEVTPSKQNKGQ